MRPYSLTQAALEQRREAARTRRRDWRGRFLSRLQVQAQTENFLRWLHERPGRAGGVARADSATRDEFGCFTCRMTF